MWCARGHPRLSFRVPQPPATQEVLQRFGLLAHRAGVDLKAALSSKVSVLFVRPTMPQHYHTRLTSLLLALTDYKRSYHVRRLQTNVSRKQMISPSAPPHPQSTALLLNDAALPWTAPKDHGDGRRVQRGAALPRQHWTRRRAAGCHEEFQVGRTRVCFEAGVREGWRSADPPKNLR